MLFVYQKGREKKWNTNTTKHYTSLANLNSKVLAQQKNSCARHKKDANAHFHRDRMSREGLTYIGIKKKGR